jgi:hypothetical protein
MPIVRNNSFHLLLSDDELELLRLLAERDGLNASDYLRSLLRQMAGAPAHLAQAIRLSAALAGRVDLGKTFDSQLAALKLYEEAEAGGRATTQANAPTQATEKKIKRVKR